MLGERIKELRNQANLTQHELAEGIISRTYLSLIEKNSVHPSTNVLKKLSERLNCTLEDFTRETKDNNVSLLELKKEIKWAEGQVNLSNFDKLEDFIEKEYELNEKINEYERGIIYWVYASYAHFKNDDEKTCEYLHMAIELVKNARNVNVYLKCLTLLGQITFDKGEKVEGIDILSKALHITIYENIVSLVKINILWTIAEMYRKIGENHVTVHFCHEALELNKKLQSHHRALELEVTLSKAYLSLKMYEKAENHYKNAIKIASIYYTKFEHIAYINNLGMLYSEQGKYKEAYQLYLKCIEMLAEDDYVHPYKFYIYMHYAKACNDMGYYEEALHVIDKYAKDDETGYSNEILGDIYYNKNEKERAIEQFLIAVEGREPNYYHAMIYPKIAKVYQELGEYEKAFEFYEKSIVKIKAFTSEVI
ncbi:helix-turn-helix domain-containing protein [Macrococcus sp. DPC7161]|uniref:helix-turn-helix domain-containing protein n=1 Tax=Macrococcus sp. DPC7161 TaxID=2507060 RepID=UPI0013E974B3|nr:helix-turn-helix domain-containing protein [Macrococcus sp. DPC7161]